MPGGWEDALHEGQPEAQAAQFDKEIAAAEARSADDKKAKATKYAQQYFIDGSNDTDTALGKLSTAIAEATRNVRSLSSAPMPAHNVAHAAAGRAQDIVSASAQLEFLEFIRDNKIVEELMRDTITALYKRSRPEPTVGEMEKTLRGALRGSNSLGG